MNKLRFLILIFSLIFNIAVSASDRINVNTVSSLAIHGFDTVAYFTQSKPVEGSSDFTVEYKGATWAFANKEHQLAFEENPMAFAPQYGGHCAYAAGLNAVADIDPTAWSVIDNKLYLNYNEPTKQTWLSRYEHYIESANKNWPLLTQQ